MEPCRDEDRRLLTGELPPDERRASPVLRVALAAMLPFAVIGALGVAIQRRDAIERLRTSLQGNPIVPVDSPTDDLLVDPSPLDDLEMPAGGPGDDDAAGEVQVGNLNKMTWAASNTSAFEVWATAHLPVFIAEDTNDHSSCGSFGRVSLCRSNPCAEDLVRIPLFGADGNQTGWTNQSLAFGLHVVDARLRPEGNLPVEFVEQQFAQKVGPSTFDAFLEYGVAVYAPEGLDSYIADLWDDPATRCHLQKWSGEPHDHRTAPVYYSFFILVPKTQIVLEIVSDVEPTYAGRELSWTESSFVRVPHTVFEATGAFDSPNGTLTPLVVSKATSNLTMAVDFYTQVLGARLVNRTGSSVKGAPEAAFFSLSYNAVDNGLVRLVEHPADHTYGVLSVRQLEENKMTTHKNALESVFCGFDRWFDNHYAFSCDDGACPLMDTWQAGAKHWYGNLATPLMHVWREPAYNMYLVDPTGDAIQLMGNWNATPVNASANAADLCSLGSCNVSLTATPSTPTDDALLRAAHRTTDQRAHF